MDEVDYMTKNAQRALRDLIQNYDENVRYCLICNYISKIEQGLRDEFVRLRFNRLDEKNIINYLKKIATSEKLNLNFRQLKQISNMFTSDIRSMINFLQANQYNFKNTHILENKSIKTILCKLLTFDSIQSTKLINYISKQCVKYNINKKDIINRLFNFIVDNFEITAEFLKNIEFLYHCYDIQDDKYIEYSSHNIIDFIKK